jgi:hypothetical protein
MLQSRMHHVHNIHVYCHLMISEQTEYSMIKYLDKKTQKQRYVKKHKHTERPVNTAHCQIQTPTHTQQHNQWTKQALYTVNQSFHNEWTGIIFVLVWSIKSTWKCVRKLLLLLQLYRRLCLQTITNWVTYHKIHIISASNHSQQHISMYTFY